MGRGGEKSLQKKRIKGDGNSKELDTAYCTRQGEDAHSDASETDMKMMRMKTTPIRRGEEGRDAPFGV